MFARKYGIACYPTRQTAKVAADFALLVAIVLVCVAVMSAMSGCSLFAPPTTATPADLALQQVVAAEGVYLVVTTPIDLAISNGDIKGNEAKALQAAEKIAWDYIMAAHDAAKAGHTVDVDTQLQLFKGARDDLVKAFDKTKPAAVTQPG